MLCVYEPIEFLVVVVNTVLYVCIHPLNWWSVGGQMDTPFGQSICRSHDGP